MVSARVLNILKRAGLTLEQAAGMPQAELRKLSGLGWKGLNELSEYFAEVAEKVVVTRHPGLIEHLRKEGLVHGDIRVIEHASIEDVRGKHVFGVLPLWLAAEAMSVTEVTLNLPPEARGRELTLAEVQRYMTGCTTYVVRRSTLPR